MVEEEDEEGEEGVIAIGSLCCASALLLAGRILAGNLVGEEEI